MWNYFNHDGPRTIMLKAGIIGGMEGLFEFVEVIQKEQGTAEVTIQQLSGGGRVRAEKRKVVSHEETIMELTEEFTGGIKTLESF